MNPDGAQDIVGDDSECEEDEPQDSGYESEDEDYGPLLDEGGYY